MTVTAPIDALRSMQDELWDADRGMVRMPPGVAPGADIASLNLHSIRETALGAFLDLESGNVARATTAIRSLLELQHPLSQWPWSGTFPVTAEQPEPPGDDAVEWVHYDPNWRQFIGCILALTAIHHGPLLPADVTSGIDAALVTCVRGEPPTRIPRWYTNPLLMHAWLLGHVGRSTGDTAMVTEAEDRTSALLERFERYGDVDEYNSPTYDGIDLFALALWVGHPPTAAFTAAGTAMLRGLGARISTLFHPTFGTTCGPYIRAYGLDPRRYVSLGALCALVAGQPAELVLPPVLDPDTDHVHDLWFLAVLQALGPVIAEHLSIRPLTTDGTSRHHLQRFSGSQSESLLEPTLAVGWESGRRHTASLDQYVPFTAHFLIDGAPTSFGLMVPQGTTFLDVRRLDDDDDGLVFEVRSGGDRAGLRVVSGAAVTIDGDDITVGRVGLHLHMTAADVRTRSTPMGHDLLITSPASEMVATLSIRHPSAANS